MGHEAAGPSAELDGGGADAEGEQLAARDEPALLGRQAVHRTRSAIEHDRERDVLLQNAGWTVLRFTRRQIEERPAYCAEQIAAAHERLGRRPR